MPYKFLYAKYLLEELESRKYKPREIEAEKLINQFYRVEPLTFDRFVLYATFKMSVSKNEIEINIKINENDLNKILKYYYYYLVPGHIFYYERKELIGFLNDIIKFGQIRNWKRVWDKPPKAHWHNKNKSRTYISMPMCE